MDKAKYVSDNFPKPGVDVRAAIGEPIYFDYKYNALLLAKLDEEVTVRNNDMSEVIPIGEALDLYAIIKNKGEVIACTKRTYSLTPRFSYPVCLKDIDSDGKFDEVALQTGSDVLWSRLKRSGIMYSTYESKTIITEGIKKEILYQGISGNVLRLKYREYNNEVARSSFYQDLTYTMNDSDSTIIRFKDIQFEVYDAGNSYIKYKML
ncbi:MAG: hypothetical protein K1562_15785 [Candidatus Thiodiazotropha sp. (ex. Lucinisca nassula)]|nr:hypothetical protein [Candidatus Thiodiazotropha sp. (ex. Lucinisca nassula)]